VTTIFMFLIGHLGSRCQRVGLSNSVMPMAVGETYSRRMFRRVRKNNHASTTSSSLCALVRHVSGISPADVFD